MKFKSILTVIMLCSSALFMACSSTHNEVKITSNAADGFDLTLLGEVLKNTKLNAEKIEQTVNDEATGINNVDLNEDGDPDIISVREYDAGPGIAGYSLYIKLSSNENDIQELCDIKVKGLNGTQAVAQIQGNEQIYGPDAYYSTDLSFTDALVLSILLRPHPYYISPGYYPGYYPGWYHPYHVVPMTAYRTRTQTITRTVTRTTTPRVSSTVKSPMAGRAAPSVRAPLSNPTATQKEFQVRNPSKAVGTGGFGSGSKPGGGSTGSKPSGFGGSKPSAPSKPSTPSRSTPSRSFGRK